MSMLYKLLKAQALPANANTDKITKGHTNKRPHKM